MWPSVRNLRVAQDFSAFSIRSGVAPPATIACTWFDRALTASKDQPTAAQVSASDVATHWRWTGVSSRLDAFIALRTLRSTRPLGSFAGVPYCDPNENEPRASPGSQ